MDQAMLLSWLLSTLVTGMGQEMSQSTQDTPPLDSACQPAVSLRLVADTTLSERGSGRIWVMGPLDLPWEVPFRLQGRLCICSPVPSNTSDSVLDYFPELIMAEPLVSTWVGPLQPRVCTHRKPRVFLWFSCVGEVPVWFPGKCMEYLHPKARL